MTYIPTNTDYSAPVKSTVNSSASTLTNGSTYTGTWENLSYNYIFVAVSTDQDGVLYVDFSHDGTTTHSTVSYNYHTDVINPPHALVKATRYTRVRFTNNSGSDQTTFNLHTSYGQFNVLSTATNSTLARSFDAVATRPTDYKSEVATGLRQGDTLWNKFGYNTDIDAAAAETVWAYGGTFSHMTAAATLNITSSSSADTNTGPGTGLQRLLIYGIDANFESQVELINMNGTSTVTTTNTWRGVNRMVGYIHGSSETNVGNITATATGGGSTVQAYIPASEGVTQQAIFHVQANHTFVLSKLFLNVNKISAGNPTVTLSVWVYSHVSNGKYKIFQYVMDVDVETHIELPFYEGFPVTEKSIIWVEADTDKNDTVVNVRFSGIEHRLT